MGYEKESTALPRDSNHTVDVGYKIFSLSRVNGTVKSKAVALLRLNVIG